MSPKVFLFTSSLLICLAWESDGARLLTSYLPVSMQALAYYIDQLQYEPLSTTTVEPPFSAPDNDLVTPTPDPTETSTPMPTSSNSWWWSSSTSTTAKPPTTPRHKPGIYAPEHALERQKVSYFDEIGVYSEGFADLSLSLLRDIHGEVDHDVFNNDIESLDNFLRLYDDNYGRVAFHSQAPDWPDDSTAGKKRVPPTKPYVDFLLVYDLLKRDAKAENLSRYEGYSDDLLSDLHELSTASAARQLYTIFKRMLDRGDVRRSDVVSRIQDIVTDLGDPNSKTAKSLRFIPALTFSP